jgi:hypothetical protein
MFGQHLRGNLYGRAGNGNDAVAIVAQGRQINRKPRFVQAIAAPDDKTLARQTKSFPRKSALDEQTRLWTDLDPYLPRRRHERAGMLLAAEGGRSASLYSNGSSGPHRITVGSVESSAWRTIAHNWACWMVCATNRSTREKSAGSKRYMAQLLENSATGETIFMVRRRLGCRAVDAQPWLIDSSLVLPLRACPN